MDGTLRLSVCTTLFGRSCFRPWQFSFLFLSFVIVRNWFVRVHRISKCEPIKPISIYLSIYPNKRSLPRLMIVDRCVGLPTMSYLFLLPGLPTRILVVEILAWACILSLLGRTRNYEAGFSLEEIHDGWCLLLKLAERGSKGFLKKNSTSAPITTAAIQQGRFELLQHPLYKPDLASSDFILFRELKEGNSGSSFVIFVGTEGRSN